jgi:hypothetical protein
MQELSEAKVARSWDDPHYESAILKKGQRRPTTRPAKVAAVKTPMLCTNCGKTVYARSEDKCRCSIWDVGKQANNDD